MNNHMRCFYVRKVGEGVAADTKVRLQLPRYGLEVVRIEVPMIH